MQADRNPRECWNAGIINIAEAAEMDHHLSGNFRLICPSYMMCSAYKNHSISVFAVLTWKNVSCDHFLGPSTARRKFDQVDR
jgi:hypothetical protein